MPRFQEKKKGAWTLLNHVPFEGCLLVFNANARDWRSKASDFKRKHGFRFSIHTITGASRDKAHDPEALSDLYITLDAANA